MDAPVVASFAHFFSLGTANGGFVRALFGPEHLSRGFVRALFRSSFIGAWAKTLVNGYIESMGTG